MFKKILQAVLYWGIIVFITYAVIAVMFYRFQNPEKTETELFLAFPKWIMLNMSK